MDKQEVVKLARELFKARVSAAREGPGEDDGMHKERVRGISFFNDTVMEQWYRESLRTAEIIIALEEEYLKKSS